MSTFMEQLATKLCSYELKEGNSCSGETCNLLRYNLSLKRLFEKPVVYFNFVSKSA